MRPLCASTIERLIESPIPIPSSLVLKNGSKSFESTDALMPAPVSPTSITKYRPGG
jgi:hypothetical protein